MTKNSLIVKFICLLILLLGRYPSQASFGKYPIQNFTPPDYKAGIQNIDFAQNRDMRLFVANNLGVLSFNGKYWETHAFKTGKKKRSLAFDESSNRLYVGSQGEFGFFSADWNYVSLIDKIPKADRDIDEVWDVFLFNSKIYFCTFKVIYVFDGQAITVIKPEFGLNRSFLANRKLFTQSPEGKLFEIQEEQLIPGYPQNQSGQIIAGLVPHQEGYLVFYNSGQVEYTTPLGVSEKYSDLAKVLKGTYVNHVLQLSDSRLAISTQTSGLILYDLQKGQTEIINRQKGLESNACLRSFQDYAGNLWVGMQNGIALIHLNSPMRLISQEINLQGSGYDAFETEAGTYFTTSNGIYFLKKDASQCVFLTGTAGPAYGLQQIAGKLYAGHHTGLFILENGKAKKLAQTDGLWQVKQLRSNPRFAIAGTYSGLHLFSFDQSRNLHAVQKIKGFTESSRFFEEDQQGHIWVGQYYKGLFQLVLSEDLAEATVENIPDSSDFSTQEQIILGKIDQELFIANNTGLYKLDQTEHRIEKSEFYFKDIGQQPLYLFGQDRQKNIHVITEHLIGFFKQISVNNYVFVPSSLYQLRYFLNNDLLNVSVNTRNGVLFSANDGFIKYDPMLEESIKTETRPIISLVYSVTQDSQLYALKPFTHQPEKIEKLVIDHKAKHIQIDVELFQFEDPNNQYFRYFLKGFDNDYSEWSSISTKEYTNLREGEYEFSVQTRNYLGETTTSKPLSFQVKPPFHRSLLAKVLYVIAGLLALVMVSRYQKNRYKQKARSIELTRQQELAEKQKKLLEIEKEKQLALLQMEEEKMEAELRHVNNLLAASIMNLVVKNEFIENIKEELKEVRRKGKNPDTRHALEKIEKEIDTNLKLQKDWEQFEYHFNQVHGDFLTRLRSEFDDLSPNEQKLCTFLRLNLNTKEVANLMSISQRGVEVARYRLRKKLGLHKGQNLSKFILEY